MTTPFNSFASLSVVIPTHNRAALLPAAIASVRAQAHPALELIVVDDGSTDETAEIVRARGDVDVYVRQESAGQAAARNAGIRRAGGGSGSGFWIRTTCGRRTRCGCMRRRSPSTARSRSCWANFNMTLDTDQMTFTTPRFLKRALDLRRRK